MGHAIHALVLPRDEARSLIAQHPEFRAFALPQNFAIVPLNAELVDALVDRMRVAIDEVMRILSSARTFAQIETDYFGGTGEQRAAFWRDGQATFSTEWREGDAINEALRMLGVETTGSDEFDALGLVRFRGFDAFGHAEPL